MKFQKDMNTWLVSVQHTIKGSDWEDSRVIVLELGKVQKNDKHLSFPLPWLQRANPQFTIIILHFTVAAAIPSCLTEINKATSSVKVRKFNSAAGLLLCWFCTAFSKYPWTIIRHGEYSLLAPGCHLQGLIEFVWHCYLCRWRWRGEDIFVAKIECLSHALSSGLRYGKNKKDSQQGKEIYFLILLDLCPESHIWCLSI